MTTAAESPAAQLVDQHARAVVRDAIARGYPGSGTCYYVSGFTSHKAASDGRVAILAAAANLGVCCTCTDFWDILSAGDGTFTLRFQLGEA